MNHIFKLTAAMGLMITAAGCAVDAMPGGVGDANEDGDIAEAEQAVAGDTSNICYSNLTPSGWVDVQWWYSAACGTSSFVPNTKQIKQLTGYPVGTTVNACASTFPPSGWSITSSYYTSSCQYSSVPSLNPNAWTLVRSF